MSIGIYDVLANIMLAVISGYVFCVVVYTFFWTARKSPASGFTLVFYLLVLAIQLMRRFALRSFYTGISISSYLDPLFLLMEWLLLCKYFDVSKLRALDLVLLHQLGYMLTFSAVNKAMYRLCGIALSGIFPFYPRLMHEMALMALVILAFYFIVVMISIIRRACYKPLMSPVYVVGIILPTVLFIIGYVAVYPYTGNIDNNNIALLTGILLFGVNVGTWLLSTELDRRHVRLHYMNLHYAEKLEYFSQISEDGKYAMKIVHDERKHYNHMLGLLQNAQYDSLESYLHSVSPRLVDVGGRMITGNQDIDTVLNAKMADARNAGCSISVWGLLPSRMNIDPVDACILLGNCLDNAITACRDTDEHVISVEFRNLQSFLVIKIRNHYSEKQTRMLSRDKVLSRGQRHGMGLEIIKAVAEKYNGRVDIVQHDSVFTIEILLRNHQSE